MTTTLNPPKPTSLTKAETQAGITETKTNQGDNVRASWNVSMDHLREHLSHNDPEKREIFIWIFNYCLEQSIRRQEFSAKVGIDDTTIMRIMKGSYWSPKGGKDAKIRQPISDKHFRLMTTFREVEQERVLMGRSEFVQTSIAQRVWQACDLALESNSPVFLQGASHIGKTTALEHYAATNNHGKTRYLRLSASIGGVQNLLSELCEKFGISKNTGSRQKLDRLKKAITENNVILIDEVHLLMETYRKGSVIQCFETLREIYDETNCGIVFCFTNLGMKRVKDDLGNILEQFFRRSVHKYDLGNVVPIQDVEQICSYYELDFPHKGLRIEVAGIADTPYEILRQLARTSGLKSITERIRYAKKISAKAEEKISWEHFVKAHLIIEQNATTPVDNWN